ncbi:190_t:CDS:1, partial [Paraglomus brasilianum]
ILQILSITLSDDDLTPDDPLTQAYLGSLGDLEGEDVRNGLGRFDDLASVTKQLGQLVIGLKPKKGQEMDNGESEIDIEIVSGVGDGNNDGNGSQMEVNTNEGGIMTSGVTGDVGNNDNTEA